MVRKSKEVQGLLYKVAELETLLIVLIGMLDARGYLTTEEVESIFGVAEIPEILGARIKRIEEQGVYLIKARKKLLSEMLGIDTPPEEPIIEEALDDVQNTKEPEKKLH